MLIVVESGATKTAWRAVCGDGVIRAIDTDGLNPTCLDAERISSVIRKAVPVLNPEGRHIDDVLFYGAGLVSPEAAAPLAQALEMWCPFARLEFHSDLLGAARALFGDGNGIAAIMGTGSNSCLYEEGKIVSNIRPGGFILGDEGSGAALGKALLSDFVKGMLPSDSTLRISYAGFTISLPVYASSYSFPEIRTLTTHGSMISARSSRITNVTSYSGSRFSKSSAESSI